MFIITAGSTVEITSGQAWAVGLRGRVQSIVNGRAVVRWFIAGRTGNVIMSGRAVSVSLSALTVI